MLKFLSLSSFLDCVKSLLREKTEDWDQGPPSVKATLEAVLLCKATEAQETVLRSKGNLQEVAKDSPCPPKLQQ